MSRNMLLIIVSVVLSLGGLAGCDLLDPVRPTAQPDTEIFGNLLDVAKDPENAELWKVTVRVGVPKALREARSEEGAGSPEVDRGLDAIITLNWDSVVLVNGEPEALTELTPGTEVVAIPVAGTTFMIGTNRIVLDGSYLMDFDTYRQWRLPRLEEEFPEEITDPSVINTGAAELSPIPVDNGRVLYFASHLRPPYNEGGDWIGARREGLRVPEEGEVLIERTYRSELAEEGWTAPELVTFPGTEDAQVVRTSWVADDEGLALVTIVDGDGQTLLGQSRRGSRGWSEIEAIDEVGADAQDAVYLAGSTTKLAFVSSRAGGRQTDLYYFDTTTEEEPLPLEPQLNTLSSETSPRVGPDNELFFVRGDRQLLFVDKTLRELRLPGSFRSIFNQAAPTGDGKWLFFCMPRFLPGEPDTQIFVAPIGADFEIGAPVAVDEWRPGA